MNNFENQIVSSMCGHGRGWSFSKKDIASLAQPGTIDRSLSRLAEKGTVRRLNRGIFRASKPDSEHEQGTYMKPLALRLAKLSPSEHHMLKLKQDYKEMGEMIFGTRPSFEEMLETLAAVEQQINASKIGDAQ